MQQWSSEWMPLMEEKSVWILVEEGDGVELSLAEV